MKQIYPLVHIRPYSRAYGAISLEMVLNVRDPEPFECEYSILTILGVLNILSV